MSRSTSPWRRLAAPWHKIDWPAACAPLVALAAIPVVLALLDQRAGPDDPVLAWVSGITVGVALVVAAALASLDRTVVTHDPWPVVVVLAAMAAHAVTATTVGLVYEGDTGPPPTSAMAGDVVVLVCAVALVQLFPPRGLRPPPVAVGAGLGLVVATGLAGAPLPGPTGPAGAVLLVTVFLAYGVTAVVLRRHWPWSGRSRTHATMALIGLGAAQAAQGMVQSVPWLGAAAAAVELVAAGLLGSTMYAIVNRDLLAYQRRAWSWREQLLEEEEAARRERANRHAMRNMVAGISMASELLEDDDLEEPTRRRLEHTIHVEAVQLRRLLDQNPSNGVSPSVQQQLAQ